MLQRVHLRDVEGVPARRVGCTCEMWRVYPRDVEGAPARREAWKVNNFRRKSTFSGKESTFFRKRHTTRGVVSSQ